MKYYSPAKIYTKYIKYELLFAHCSLYCNANDFFSGNTSKITIQ